MTGEILLAFDEVIFTLKSKKLNFDITKKDSNQLVLAFDVWVKPGSKFEKVFISLEGVLIIQTRSRPIEGEANSAVIEAVADLMGVSKSSVEIIRGEKSRNKRVAFSLSFTASKNASFYQKKFSEILIQEA